MLGVDFDRDLIAGAEPQGLNGKTARAVRPRHQPPFRQIASVRLELQRQGMGARRAARVPVQRHGHLGPSARWHGENSTLGDFARASMLRALVFISLEHKNQRPDVEAFLRDFRHRNDDLSEDLLYSWASGIAALGMEDMVEQVRATFKLGDISPFLAGFEHFEADLQEALRNPDRSAFQKNGPFIIESAIDEMQWWYCYSEEYREKKRKDAVRNVLNVMSRQELDVAPRVNIGRNDPCPCGSGKKFKKCCLH